MISNQTLNGIVYVFSCSFSLIFVLFCSCLTACLISWNPTNVVRSFVMEMSHTHTFYLIFFLFLKFHVLLKIRFFYFFLLINCFCFWIGTYRVNYKIKIRSTIHILIIKFILIYIYMHLYILDENVDSKNFILLRIYDFGSKFPTFLITLLNDTINLSTSVSVCLLLAKVEVIFTAKRASMLR